MTLTSIDQSMQELRRFPRDKWLDLVRTDQSHRWRQRLGIFVEDYFLKLPEIRADAEEALVLITGELLLRREIGETLDVGEYQRRFPEFLDRIAVQFCVDDFLSSTDEGDVRAAGDNARDLELPGYEFLQEIGRGAAGVVYKARQTSLDRFVAIKVVAIPGADAKLLARQRQEAEILARLHHSNVVHIYEVRDHRGCLHLVMEYMDGPTLAARVRGRLPAPEEQKYAVPHLPPHGFIVEPFLASLWCVLRKRLTALPRR